MKIFGVEYMAGPNGLVKINVRAAGKGEARRHVENILNQKSGVLQYRLVRVYEVLEPINYPF